MVVSAPRRQEGNLPAEVTSFVGRRRETSETRRLLAEARLVTLTGPGGVGKSRLALHVAARVRRGFPDGVWLVDLAALGEPQLLAQTVLDTLGVREASSRPASDALAAFLADRSLLLVLDNCEHLLDECAELAATLLRTAPGLRMLATSREALRIEGEHALLVPPLPVPEAPPEVSGDNGHRAPTTEDLVGCDAVALFADRAGAVVPDFALDAHNGHMVARLVRRLDGIPLAIELAAVRLRALSPEQVLDRLTDTLRWLDTGSRAAPPRQRTLRATIDWSFELCSPAERTLWARLSVFSGGFDLEAAEAVCSGEGLSTGAVLDLCHELVAKNIVLRQEQGSRVRCRLLETIRQYGRERLATSGEEAALRRRHRDWYRRLVAQADDEWHSERQLEWFTRLRSEHANLRAAFDFCLTVPGEARVGLEMTAGLRSYWHASGSVAEGRRWMGQLLELDAEPTATLAKAVRVAGYLALFHNDVEAAQPLVRQARELAERVDDPGMLAWATHLEGFAVLFSEDATAAVALFERALAGFRALHDSSGTVISLFYLASALTLVEAGRAEALGNEAVALSELLGERWMRGWTLWTLGVAAWRRGDTRRAVELERQAIRHKQLFNDRFGIAQCIEVLAWSAATDGQPERAARLLGGLTVIWREVHASLYRHLIHFHDEVRQSLLDTLGQRAFDTAFDAGTRLGYERVVDEALCERAARGAPDRAQAPTALTRRETQIADLVARGMSNKEVGAALVISKRTADTHVENILNKLGFTSRTQITAWVAEHRQASTQGTHPPGAVGDTPPVADPPAEQG